MVARRGEIWWADLGDRVGSEPSDLHPVIVVQRDDLNESKLQTTLVIAMTSNLERAHSLGNVLCRARDTGLPRDSVAVTCHLVTVDRSRFRDPVGFLPRRLLSEIENGLRLTLDL